LHLEQHFDYQSTVRPHAVPKKDLVTSETLINATLVVELKANSREDAIRELVSAFDWSQHGVSDAELIVAIEEREATAQTMVAEDLAIPHASVDWDGDFRVILGRSRDGVPFGAKGEPVRLVVLLVIGRQQAARHLQVLATLAGLLQAPDFRSALIAAKNTAALLRHTGSAGRTTCEDAERAGTFTGGRPTCQRSMAGAE
jgi:mannitol/fructose-specific phosphotransferase system IIA component (Ntr-type)